VGLFYLICGLSWMAAFLVLQFLSLGYMLEEIARVARCGRLRDGLFGLDVARKLGTIFVCSWLILLPMRIVRHLARSSQLIHGSDTTFDPWVAASLVPVPFVLVYIAWACYRGGRVRDFIWPAPIRLWRELTMGALIVRWKDRFWTYFASLRMPERLCLGCVGFVGGFCWLAPPVTLLLIAANSDGPVGFIVWTLGAIFLGWAAWMLPLLQVRFAMTGNWRTLYDVRSVQTIRHRAPMTHLLALTLLLILTLPLYLLKVELISREVAWLPNLLFVASILPTKLVMGWSTYVGLQRCVDASWIWQCTAAVLVTPVIALYILVVYATQYTIWYGLFSLYEQHAFLLPVPFWQW